MIQQMTQRERTLAMLVGGILFVFVNLFLVKYFVNQHRQLRADLAAKAITLDTMHTLLAERDLWLQRAHWLGEKQPPLTNSDGAAVALLEAAKEIAKKHSITLENSVLGKVDNKPHYSAVSVNFDTKSKWQDLVAFLREMQAPEQFIVFENANLQKDSGDQTQMRGRFKLAKWFAPK